MSQPGTIGHGMPARPNDVQRRLRELTAQIDQMHGMVVQAVNKASMAATTAQNAANTAQSAANTANQATTLSKGFQQDVNSVSFPNDNTYHPYCTTSVVVPDGFSYALLLIAATAGTTFSGAGNISVAATANGTIVGNAMDNGVPGASPCSAVTIFSEAVGPLTSGQTITLGAEVATNGAQGAGAGNVHVSGFFTFSH